MHPTPFTFDLQLFAGEEDAAKKAAEDAAAAKAAADAIAAKAAADKEKADREKADAAARLDAEDDLSKKTASELVEYARHLRKQSAGYRTRAQSVEKERDDAKGKLDGYERAKLEADKQYQELAKRDREAREAAERDRDAAKTEASRVRIFGEVRDAARAAGLTNTKILTHLDMGAIKAHDDGSIDARDVDAFVRNVKADYPEFFPDAEATKKQREDEQKRADADKKKRDEEERRRSTARRNDSGDKVDWSSLTPEQFAAEEQKLLGGASYSRV